MMLSILQGCGRSTVVENSESVVVFSEVNKHQLVSDSQLKLKVQRITMNYLLSGVHLEDLTHSGVITLKL